MYNSHETSVCVNALELLKCQMCALRLNTEIENTNIVVIGSQLFQSFCNFSELFLASLSCFFALHFSLNLYFVAGTSHLYSVYYFPLSSTRMKLYFQAYESQLSFCSGHYILVVFSFLLQYPNVNINWNYVNLYATQ